MGKKKRNLLQGDQLALVVDEVNQGDRGVITLLCDESKLDRLLEFAQQNLGDRLVSRSVLVDLSIENATEADLELFRRTAAPVEMVVDWEMEVSTDG